GPARNPRLESAVGGGQGCWRWTLLSLSSRPGRSGRRWAPPWPDASRDRARNEADGGQINRPALTRKSALQIIPSPLITLQISRTPMHYTPPPRDPTADPIPINLLSDTQTRPTAAMREAMARAEVGD